MRYATVLVLIALACAVPGCVQGPPAANARAVSPDATGDIDNLSWLVGEWTGEGLGGEIEEVFFEPRAGAMPGVFRLIHMDEGGDERIVFYEFILIEQEPGGESDRDRVMMRLHHFNPGMSRWEDEPVTFTLVELAGTRAVFREVDDDAEDSRLVYTRAGDSLVVELIERGGDGADRVAARFAFTLQE